MEEINGLTEEEFKESIECEENDKNNWWINNGI